MPLSGLTLRGVPVEEIHRFTAGDALEDGFIRAQAEFDSRRAPGTPLLPDATSAPALPAPHLRALITDLLVAAAGGPAVGFDGVDAQMAYAELRLGLIEAYAGFIASAPLANTAAPSPTGVTAVRPVSALPQPRPEWLDAAAGQSYARVRTSRAPRPVASSGFEAASPVLRVALESAGLRATPALGAEERAGTARWSEALAVAADDVVVRLAPPPPAPRAPLEREVEDLALARAALARRAVGRGDAPFPPSNLPSLVLARLNPAVAGPGGRAGFVVSADTVVDALNTHDVMLNYVLHPM